MYPTLKATVQNGKIQLLEDIGLPENAMLLVTVMDDALSDTFSLGEHLIAGLQDIASGRVVQINSSEELHSYLDSVLGKA
ncbi:MAG TPA: hypothetical protein G4N94_01790 [Caldilineae bacterium]|nr:hypothetical protein [Caldilineae bacterium]